MQYGIRNSKRIGFLICNFCIALTGCINATFVLKITQISVKLDFKLATIWPIFLAISRTSFLARNVSQNHFPFSREMREMCKSSVERGYTSCIFSGQEVILLHIWWVIDGTTLVSVTNSTGCPKSIRVTLYYTM